MLYNKDWEHPVVYSEIGNVLLKAADLLEEYGHIKYIRRDMSGSMCFLGALQEAQGILVTTGEDTPLTIAASAAVVKFLDLKPTNKTARMYIGHDYYHAVLMAEWNNAEERTGQEVIDAMRQTAETQRVSAAETQEVMA